MASHEVMESAKFACDRHGGTCEEDWYRRGGGWAHKSAVVEESVVIGEHATVGPCAFLGPNTILGRYASVGECCFLEDGSRIGPHAVLGSASSFGHWSEVPYGMVVEPGAAVPGRIRDDDCKQAPQ